MQSQAAIDDLFNSEKHEIDSALPFAKDKFRKLLHDKISPQDDKIINLEAILLLQNHVESLKRKKERERLDESTGVTVLQELENFMKKFSIIKKTDNS